MTDTMAQSPAAPEPICVACVGDGLNADGGDCPRCHGSGTDPDPDAPTGIPVMAP